MFCVRLCIGWCRGDDYFFFFFFNDTATTEIYTLSLHDALPISRQRGDTAAGVERLELAHRRRKGHVRSEEHTSELQSQSNLVCRLLLEKKKKKRTTATGLDDWPAPPHTAVTSRAVRLIDSRRYP